MRNAQGEPPKEACEFCRAAAASAAGAVSGWSGEPPGDGMERALGSLLRGVAAHWSAAFARGRQVGIAQAKGAVDAEARLWASHDGAEDYYNVLRHDAARDALLHVREQIGVLAKEGP